MLKCFTASGHPWNYDRVVDPRVVEELKKTLRSAADFDTFWRVVDVTGRHWYAAKGHPLGRGQVVVWYPNGAMWSSYGKTVPDAIEKSLDDAWQYL